MSLVSILNGESPLQATDILISKSANRQTVATAYRAKVQDVAPKRKLATCEVPEERGRICRLLDGRGGGAHRYQAIIPWSLPLYAHSCTIVLIFKAVLSRVNS